MKKHDDLSWMESLRIPEDLSPRDYEFSGDREALAALKALPGAGALMARWVEFWLEFSRTGFLGASIKVSAKQFPDVDALRRRCAEVLSLTPPPVFIIEQPIINAYTLGTDQNNAIVAITRPLFESATPRELAFILGHEFGHIKSQHALYATVAVVLANMGLFYGSRMLPIHLLIYPLEMALKAWFRRSEITCDRAGLVACQDLDAARRALLLLGCCSRDLADRIDLDEFRRQDEEVSRSYGRWGEMLLTHPTLPKRIRCLEAFSESHLYLRRVQGDKRSAFLPPEEVDAAAAAILGNEAPAPEKMKESGREARLKALLAFAGAWSGGALNPPRRRALEELLSSCGVSAAEAEELRRHLDSPPKPGRVVRELRYFKGDRLQALPYAFSFLLLGSEEVTHRQVKFLHSMAAACGVGEGQAEGVVFDVAARKRFFKELCGSDICAACGRLIKTDAPACACGTDSSGLEEPDSRRVKRLSDRLEDLGKAADRAARGAGGGLLKALARGLDSAAGLLDPPPKK